MKLFSILYPESFTTDELQRDGIADSTRIGKGIIRNRKYESYHIDDVRCYKKGKYYERKINKTIRLAILLYKWCADLIDTYQD